jgi:hypothetical protein
MKTIGLMGLKGSGKDTVGQYFSDQYGYTPISFADSLKDCLASIFGWDRMMLEGRNPKSRAWREQVDIWWAERLNIPGFTPRFAMTHFGTDIMRNHFDDGIWILNTHRKIEQTLGPVMLTDVRFPNEYRLVQQLGGVTIRIERGKVFPWVDHARALLSRYEDLPPRHEIDSFNALYGVHESEWYLVNRVTDFTIGNNSNIPSLYRKCEDIAQQIGLPVNFP